MTHQVPQHQDLLANLTEEQYAAVTRPADATLLVDAGAGTGKTRMLAYRTLSIVQQGHPLDSLLLLTFTNKAAAEMLARIAAIFHGPDANPATARPMPTITTFHSLGARLLRTPPIMELANLHLGIDLANATILSEDNQTHAMQEAGRTLLPAGSSHSLEAATATRAIKLLNRTHQDHASIATLLAELAEHPVLPADFRIPRTRDITSLPMPDLLAAYDAYKRRHHLLDYDDLIALPVRLLMHDTGSFPRWRAILVDEYQDTSPLQDRFLELLRNCPAEGTTSPVPLTAVGDPAQLLYAWRGASPDVFLGLPQRTPCEQLSLTRNWRSTQPILDAANAALRLPSTGTPVPGRLTAATSEQRDGCAPVTLHTFPNAYEEADWICRTAQDHVERGGAYSDLGVLARTHLALTTVDHTAQRLSVPANVVSGTRFTSRQEIRDIAAWISLTLNPSDNAACQRALQFPKRGIGEASIKQLASHAASRQISLLEAIPHLIRRRAFRPATAKALDHTLTLHQLLREAAARSARDLLQAVLDDTGLLTAYRADLDSKDPAKVQAAERRLDRIALLFDLAEQHSLPATLAECLAVSDTSPARRDVGFTVSTIHAAKGREWPIVILLALELGLFPRDGDADPAEERRILHVALSRARTALHLTTVRDRNGVASQPSPYLALLRAHVPADSLATVDHQHAPGHYA